MKVSVPESLLARLSDFVASQMGLHFPRERWGELERGTLAAARELGFENVESCLHWLWSEPLTRKQVEMLASYLTVGETYFFRERRAFEALETEVLPELIRMRQGAERRLRIWSAGCATGEEPYSVALLLRQSLADLQDWNITLLATDINPRFLQRAAEGRYPQWSFRDTPPWVQERWFREKKKGSFEILPSLRRMVTFSYLNLAEDVYPSLWNNTNAMDIIFCRNVLMYFAPQAMKKVVEKLYRSLVDGGWLVVSPSEASHLLFSQFVTVNFPGATLYRKDSKRPATAPPPPSRMDESPEVSLPLTLGPPAETPWEFGFPPGLPEPVAFTPAQEEVAKPEPPSYVNAVALYERGQYREAGEEVGAWLQEQPTDAGAMALLARIYANQGQLAEALGWCDKAIAADKLSASHYYLRATILQERGSLEEAERALQRTLYLDPAFVPAYVVLGHLSRQRGKAKECEKHFENALSLLSRYQREETLRELEGVTAGRLIEIIQSTSRERSA